MSVLRSTAKATISGLGYYSGAFDAWAWLEDRRRGPGLAILTYHRVLTPEQARTEPDPGLVTTVETFAAHMRFVAERYRPLPLSEAVEELHAGSALPRRACAVTFDDGWSDNYTNAYPILRQLRIPATVFVATAHVGTRTPLWTRRALHVLRHAREAGLWPQAHDSLAGAGVAMDEIASHGPRQLKTIVRELGRLPAETRESVIDHLASVVACPPTADDWVTWEQLREMRGNGIDIGSHTCHHVVLTAESAERAEVELTTSRADLERELGCRPRTFGYPHGACDDRVADLVRRSGYALACSTAPGRARAASDRYRLPRIAVDEGLARGWGRGFSRARFVAQIEGELQRRAHAMRGAQAARARRRRS